MGKVFRLTCQLNLLLSCFMLSALYSRIYFSWRYSRKTCVRVVVDLRQHNVSVVVDCGTWTHGLRLQIFFQLQLLVENIGSDSTHKILAPATKNRFWYKKNLKKLNSILKFSRKLDVVLKTENLRKNRFTQYQKCIPFYTVGGVNKYYWLYKNMYSIQWEWTMNIFKLLCFSLAKKGAGAAPTRGSSSRSNFKLRPALAKNPWLRPAPAPQHCVSA